MFSEITFYIDKFDGMKNGIVDLNSAALQLVLSATFRCGSLSSIGGGCGQRNRADYFPWSDTCATQSSATLEGSQPKPLGPTDNSVTLKPIRKHRKQSRSTKSIHTANTVREPSLEKHQKRGDGKMLTHPNLCHRIFNKCCAKHFIRFTLDDRIHCNT